MINCVRNIVKVAVEPRAVREWFFDNVMTKLTSLRGQTHNKTDVNLSFTITRPQIGQMLEMNEGKRRSKLAVNRDK